MYQVAALQSQGKGLEQLPAAALDPELLRLQQGRGHALEIDRADQRPGIMTSGFTFNVLEMTVEMTVEITVSILITTAVASAIAAAFTGNCSWQR
jgi:hypothetical protein